MTNDLQTNHVQTLLHIVTSSYSSVTSRRSIGCVLRISVLIGRMNISTGPAKTSSGHTWHWRNAKTVWSWVMTGFSISFPLTVVVFNLLGFVDWG